MFTAVGQPIRAGTSVRIPLEIDERLVRADPGNTQYLRDLLLSHEKAGGQCQALGKGEIARYHHHKAWQIAERLAADDHDNTRVQCDLAFRTSQLAEILDSLGDSSSFVMWASANRILSALDAAGLLADDYRRLFDYVTDKVEGTPQDFEKIRDSQ